MRVKKPLESVPAKKYDLLWQVRQGVMRAFFLVGNKDIQDQVEKRFDAKQEIGPLPLVIQLHCSIFVRHIYVAMGDRAGCEDLLRQLTDTKGSLSGNNPLNVGLSFQISPCVRAIWVQHNWHQMRDTEGCVNLSHEALHCTEGVMEEVGMSPHKENEELRAYYGQWITDTICAMVKWEPWDWVKMGIHTKTIIKSQTS